MPQLRSYGRILQHITPALIAIDSPDVVNEQKINLTVRALSALGRELNCTNLCTAANVLDNIHWLANITLPEVADQTTVEQALQRLDLSLGNVTIANLRKKGLALGLTEKELVQILYANQQTTSLATPDQELLAATKENKRYAAVGGLVAKLGQDLNCKDLERVGVAAVCAVSMRQTYYELKTSNLTAVNFSESLGLILSSVGMLTNNKTVAQIGSCIIEGVTAYAGIMAVPGGSIIAVPLAICAALSKLLLGRKSKAADNAVATEAVLQQLLQQIVSLQLEMRAQFANLYQLLQEQHQQLLNALEYGFANLASCTQYYALQNSSAFKNLDRKLDAFHADVSKKLADLYLEYVHDPMEEIQFFAQYNQGDSLKLQANKLKLSMWLLYKSKNCKVNGRDLISTLEGQQSLAAYVAMLLSKIGDYDAVLGLINRYVNIEFNQQLPEELPHIPTWILAADKYVFLLNNYSEHLDLKATEPQILADIISIGEQVLDFVRQLAANTELLTTIVETVHEHLLMVRLSVLQILDNNRMKCLYGLPRLRAEYLTANSTQQLFACSAPTDEQLERFDAVSLDVSSMWQQYLQPHIPVEFAMAAEYELGELQLKFAIDKDLNGFLDVHMAYGSNSLPNSARDVIYRIDVYFKSKFNNQPHLILAGYFSYDLLTSANRFEQYYRRKFVNRLSHTRYHWISINGRQNHVEGNQVTDTNKPVNFAKLAIVYTDWWQQVQPVNVPSVLARVKQNPKFYAKYKTMLDQGRCVDIEQVKMASLQAQLQLQLQQAVLKQRINIASVLQEDKVISAILDKVDAYNAVLTAFKQILHINGATRPVSAQVQQLLGVMQQAGSLDLNLHQQLDALFCANTVYLDTTSDYRQGIFYQKVNYTLSQLRLLANTLPTFSLRL